MPFAKNFIVLGATVFAFALLAHIPEAQACIDTFADEAPPATNSVHAASLTPGNIAVHMAAAFGIAAVLMTGSYKMMKQRLQKSGTLPADFRLVFAKANMPIFLLGLAIYGGVLLTHT